MAELHNHRKIVTDGLVFVVDSGNIRSYSGSGTSVNSMSDLSQTGTLVNGVSFVDNSFDFDGLDDYIDFGQVSVFPWDNMTFEFWVKIDTASNNNRILDYHLNILRGITIYIATSGDLTFRYADGANRTNALVDVNSHIGDGNFHHYVIQYESGIGNTTYIDGVSQGIVSTNTGTITPANPTETLRIGDWQSGGSRAFDGKIPNVKIHNRVLTSDEVLQNYNANKTRFT